MLFMGLCLSVCGGTWQCGWGQKVCLWEFWFCECVSLLGLWGRVSKCNQNVCVFGYDCTERCVYMLVCTWQFIYVCVCVCVCMCLYGHFLNKWGTSSPGLWVYIRWVLEVWPFKVCVCVCVNVSHFHGPIFAMEHSPAFSLMRETNHVLCDHTHTYRQLLLLETHRGLQGEKRKRWRWKEGWRAWEGERGWRGKEALCTHNASVCGLKPVLCFEQLPTRRELPGLLLLTLITSRPARENT